MSWAPFLVLAPFTSCFLLSLFPPCPSISLHFRVCDTWSHYTSSPFGSLCCAGCGGIQVPEPNEVQACQRAISRDTGPTNQRNRERRRGQRCRSNQVNCRRACLVNIIPRPFRGGGHRHSVGTLEGRSVWHRGDNIQVCLAQAGHTSWPRRGYLEHCQGVIQNKKNNRGALTIHTLFSLSILFLTCFADCGVCFDLLLLFSRQSDVVWSSIL